MINLINFLTSFEVLAVIKTLIVTIFITRFEPISMVLDTIEDSYPKIGGSIQYTILRMILECSRCFAFWFGSIYGGSFFLGMISSIGAMFFERTLGSWLDKQILK